MNFNVKIDNVKKAEALDCTRYTVEQVYAAALAEWLAWLDSQPSGKIVVTIEKP